MGRRTKNVRRCTKNMRRRTCSCAIVQKTWAVAQNLCVIVQKMCVVAQKTCVGARGAVQFHKKHASSHKICSSLHKKHGPSYKICAWSYKKDALFFIQNASKLFRYELFGWATVQFKNNIQAVVSGPTTRLPTNVESSNHAKKRGVSEKPYE
jgi:hypothetical protein